MKKLYIDIFENEKGIKAFFSTKYGASEGSPYYHDEALEQLGMKDKILVQLNQVHEDNVEVVDEEAVKNCHAAFGRDSECGCNGQPAIKFPKTDGVITDQKGVLLTTVHADCLPVWFYDKDNGAIGVVHAGWRGTLAGIAPKAVKLMHDTYGSDPAKIKAYIGPGISQCCFETGPEVIEAFREKWAFADKYAKPKGEKYYIDLKGINAEELLQAGLLKGNITVSEHCTCCEPETFASYRREGGTYMRMGAGICLE